MMQMQTLNHGADTPTILPLATLAKLAVLDPREQDIVDYASKAKFIDMPSVQSVLKALARALEDYVYWDSIMHRDIRPMRRRADMRLTRLQKVIAFETEQNVMDSWTLVSRHIDTLNVLTR